MSRVTFFVGIDYHQDGSQVCVMDREGTVLGTMRCASDVDYILKYVQFIAGKDVRVVAVVEACCGASELADRLKCLNWSVTLAHPGYVSRLKQSPDKTDKQDAELLADLVRVNYVPTVWLAPEPIRQLRSLFRHRQQLAERKRAQKLRIRGLMRESHLRLVGRPWTVDWLAKLKENSKDLGEHRAWIVEETLDELESVTRRMKKTESRLAEFVAHDPISQKLAAQAGIGLVTVAALRAEVGDFARFRTGKQLSRYCGLSPRNASSGNRQSEAGLIRAGSKQLRTVLIEAGQRLRRYDPRWKELSEKLKSQGKPTSLVVAAVANRWIRWLHHEMTKQDDVHLEPAA